MISSQEFQEEHKEKAGDFTRQRILTFPKLVIGLINLFNRTVAVELSKLLDLFSCRSCSKQAFSEQRQKLKPRAFTVLNDALIKAFYADDAWLSFHGFRLLAGDGSTLQLPESQAVGKHFGYVSNQHSHQAMGRCSLLYDIENRMTLSAQLKAYGSSEKAMLAEQLELIGDEVPTLLVLDQGYRSLTLMYQISQKGWHFIVRVPGQGFLSEVKEAATAGQQDVVLSIDLQRGWRAHDARLKALAQQLYDQSMALRLVAVDLPDGKVEYLLSNLLDQTAYSTDFFYQAYGKRWGIETQYGFNKTILELENFSAKTVVGVEQDFYASILCSNISALMNLDAQEQLQAEALVKQQQGKGNQHHYQVNRSVSLGLMKDRIVTMLWGEQSLEEQYEALVNQMKNNKVLSKKGRQFQRKRKRPLKPRINRRRPT